MSAHTKSRLNADLVIDVFEGVERGVARWNELQKIRHTLAKDIVEASLDLNLEIERLCQHIDTHKGQKGSGHRLIRQTLVDVVWQLCNQSPNDTLNWLYKCSVVFRDPDQDGMFLHYCNPMQPPTGLLQRIAKHFDGSKLSRSVGQVNSSVLAIWRAYNKILSIQNDTDSFTVHDGLKNLVGSFSSHPYVSLYSAWLNSMNGSGQIGLSNLCLGLRDCLHPAAELITQVLESAKTDISKAKETLKDLDDEWSLPLPESTLLDWTLNHYVP
jgi:hypothetical protein